MRRCAVVLATALISVTALAGCGSADDEASEAADETSSSSTDDASPTEDAESPDDNDDATDDGADSGDKSDDGSDSDKADDADDKGDKNDAGDKSDKGDKNDDADDASGDYCAEVKSLKADFNPSNSASLANATDMDAIVDRFQDITDAAPGKIRSDWAELTSAYTGLARQLDKYDIELTDPKGFTKLKPKERKAVQSALARTQKVAGSVGAITANLRSTCGLKLQ